MKKILVDSDAFYALINPNDPNHRKAVSINLLIKQKTFHNIPLVTNLVLHEVATLLSYRLDQKIAVNFLDDVETSEIQTYFVDEHLERKVFEIFKQQKKKGTSMIDCANIAVMKELGLSTIFSFDQIYKNNGYIRAGIDQGINL